MCARGSVTAVCLCSANEESQGEVSLEAEEQWDLCRRASWAERYASTPATLFMITGDALRGPSTTSCACGQL